MKKEREREREKINLPCSIGKLFGLASFESFKLFLSWEFFQNLKLLKVKNLRVAWLILFHPMGSESWCAPQVSVFSFLASFKKKKKTCRIFSYQFVMYCIFLCIWTHYLFTIYLICRDSALSSSGLASKMPPMPLQRNSDSFLFFFFLLFVTCL